MCIGDHLIFFVTNIARVGLQNTTHMRSIRRILCDNIARMAYKTQRMRQMKESNQTHSSTKQCACMKDSIVQRQVHFLSLRSILHWKKTRPYFVRRL